MKQIVERIEQWVQEGAIAGGALSIRQDDRILFHQCFGRSCIADNSPITNRSIFRLMSMSKIITAVGVMKLVETGKVHLDDPVSLYLPAFRQPRVVQDERYAFHAELDGLQLVRLLADFTLDGVRTAPAQREITLRDLLTHSSGLQQGMVGLLASMKDQRIHQTLAAEVEQYASFPLDFQPGTDTGYSPLAGFDTLLRVCEVVSGQAADAYLREAVFEPLGMRDTGFFLNAEQQTRLVHVYKRGTSGLVDVTSTPEDMDGMLHRGPRMTSGAGGLYATLTDYERLLRMLCNEGELEHVRVLAPETVRLIRSEGPASHLEPEPGQVWGLGVRIVQHPEQTRAHATPDTYGWSGAFGTHCFISPADRLTCIWCENRSDAGGSGSEISMEIERLVFSAIKARL